MGAEPDMSPSDADLEENLLPPASSHPQHQGYVLPSNFNFSNNNLFLDGASLLSPLEHPGDPSCLPHGKVSLLVLRNKDIPVPLSM